MNFMKPIFLMTFVLATGCSMNSESFSSSPPELQPPAKPPAKRFVTASIIQVHMLLPSLRAATSVEYMENTTILNAFSKYKNALSGSGAITELSTQLVLGSMEIVAVFCNAAIQKELVTQAPKIVYPGINLNQPPTMLGPEARKAFIQNLAIRFLGRSARPEEMDISQNTIDGILASYPAIAPNATSPGMNNALGTQIVSQALCTTWGASTEALIY